MIYIPTITTKLRYMHEDYNNDYILYSPNNKIENNIKYGNKITIWDNYTFYWYRRYKGKDKEELAYNHYNWLIDFILKNYKEGITLITPDLDWLSKDKRNTIYNKWIKHCSKYPQLYIPETWDKTDTLNIVGYALRVTSKEHIHENWIHCLGHKRNNLESKTRLLTYDSVAEINL